MGLEQTDELLASRADEQDEAFFKNSASDQNFVQAQNCDCTMCGCKKSEKISLGIIGHTARGETCPPKKTLARRGGIFDFFGLLGQKVFEIGRGVLLAQKQPLALEQKTTRINR